MISTLADDAITLHYQPLATCIGGAVVGLEALMRWHHRQRGAISPEAFIPVFENSGLIVPLSRWALRQACRDAARWSNPLTVSVNLSAIQFDEGDLPTLVERVLRDSRLAPERLELEMTEAALVGDTGEAAATLRRLRDRGVGIALDDFGTGNSAAAYLTDYPFTKIKIDARIVAGIETSASARSVIHMIIDLARARGLCVSAEGVETAAQVKFLQAEGCDLMQGYLVGYPAPIEQFAELTADPTASACLPDSSTRHYAPEARLARAAIGD